jgi:hypothetical protein
VDKLMVKAVESRPPPKRAFEIDDDEDDDDGDDDGDDSGYEEMTPINNKEQKLIPE